MSVEENKVLVNRYYTELMSAGDLSFVDRHFAPEFEFTNPTHTEPYRGQEFKDLVTMLRGAFPDLKFTVEHMLAQGDTVVGHWTARGTHKGTPLKTLKGDIPAQGNPFVIDGISWIRIENGKFVEARINEDTLGLLQQIGALPAPPKPPELPIDLNEAIIDRYFNELMNQGKLEIIPEIMTEGITFRIPTLPEPIRGHDGLKAFITGLRTGFPDIQFSVERQIAEGNKVASRWYITATHQGTFLGMPATGNSIKDQGVDIFILEGGKIAEIWVNENDLGLMKQIGAFG
ncbi:MAG: ester cyclase [Leptolyngbyaceae cyanobacterium SU_3_3]|nr:ester cyclase [Leptolyngbyaceae cyanobacterium SU_3_3]NJR50608.1 ester cyclase [Leptolyngbyaceae cyanobacterium CSU_1_3]